MSLVMLTSEPAIALNDEECNQIAKATINVARHYNLDEKSKTYDIFALISILCVTAAPRIYILKQNKKDKNSDI